MKVLTIKVLALSFIFCLSVVTNHQESSTGVSGRSNTDVSIKVVRGNIDIEPHDPHTEEHRGRSLRYGTPIAYNAGHK